MKLMDPIKREDMLPLNVPKMSWIPDLFESSCLLQNIDVRVFQDSNVVDTTEL